MIGAGVAGRAGASGPLDVERLRARNDRLLLAALACFLVLLALVGLDTGVTLGPDVLAAAIGLALVLSVRRRPRFADLAPFLALGLAYELIRAVSGGLAMRVHVADAVDLERWLFAGRLPTEVLQAWLHPRAGPDAIALGASFLYVLHTALPFVVGGFLWLRARPAFYDFMAVLILLSVAAFMTYLLVPVAPPWWAAAHGALVGSDGQATVAYLNASSLDSMGANVAGAAGAAAGAVGAAQGSLFGLQLGSLNPDPIASFPSLHAAYPFLAYLFGRRALGRAAWLVLAYAVAVWFAVVYMGDHYVVDVAAGVAYAALAHAAVTVGPRLAGEVRLLRRPAGLRA